LDNHSDTMQLAIFKNLDGMSLGELLDFILRFLYNSIPTNCIKSNNALKIPPVNG